MQCPKCNEYAPDNNYKCPHCGEILLPDKDPADFRFKSSKRSGFNPNLVVLLIIVVGVAALIYAAFFKSKDKDQQSGPNMNAAISTSQSTGDITTGYVVNTENPGQEINIEEFVRQGKTTIFDFYSDYCGPCRRFSPLLKKLDNKRDDILVFKVDINRPNTRGIDWASPVARQYKLNVVPYFMIYDTSGNLSHKGKAAYDEVVRLLQNK